MHCQKKNINNSQKEESSVLTLNRWSQPLSLAILGRECPVTGFGFRFSNRNFFFCLLFANFTKNSLQENCKNWGNGGHRFMHQFFLSVILITFLIHSLPFLLFFLQHFFILSNLSYGTNSWLYRKSILRTTTHCTFCTNFIPKLTHLSLDRLTVYWKDKSRKKVPLVASLMRGSE